MELRASDPIEHAEVEVGHWDVIEVRGAPRLQCAADVTGELDRQARVRVTIRSALPTP